jgi:hypothetical protein
MSVRTCAGFESEAFNTTETRETYINPECYGDDLALWLMQKLGERGVEVVDEKPSQEDFGWYTTFTLGGREYNLLAGHFGGTDPPRWLVWVECAGLGRMLLGRRSRDVEAAAVQLIDEILRSSNECADVLWFRSGDRLFEDGESDPLIP